MRRVGGKVRITLFCTYLDTFRDRVRVAKEEIDDAILDGIRLSIETKERKSSAKERDKIAAGFERSIKGKSTTYKAEEVSGFELTSTMGGKVELIDLKKGSGHESLVDAEIIARGIVAGMDKFIAEYGEDASQMEVPYKDKKRFLKKHEAKNKVLENKHVTLKEAEAMTRAVKPISAELMKIDK